MFLILCIFSFIACWILGVINRIQAIRIFKKLENRLVIHPDIKKIQSPFSQNQSGIFSVILSFGAKDKTIIFLKNHLDTAAIERTEDQILKKLFARYLELTSNFAKIWIMALLSIALSALAGTLS